MNWRAFSFTVGARGSASQSSWSSARPKLSRLSGGSVKEFLDQLPQLIEAIGDELAVGILSGLKRRWRAESKRQRLDSNGFQRRLLSRWQLPLQLLQMLLTISREYGQIINERLRDPTGTYPRNLVDVVTRLHARGCQVTDEILSLLNSGFADGAMARWRTLHEIAVIALFIGSHGEEVAERYVQHQIVESRRAARDYQACHERLDYEPLEPSEVTQVEKSYDALIARFGKQFDGQYGWAAKQLGLNSPTFRDIERESGVDHLRAHYRMASHNVHANPKGVYFHLGLISERELLLAGPSNAGLADPGQCAALSLVQVSASLAMVRPTFDNIVVLILMVELAQEIGDAFGNTHLRLEGEC